MCDDCVKNDIVNEAMCAEAKGYGVAGMESQAKLKASSFRDRLESRRNSLTRQLTQVEQALQLLYTNPDAEKTYEILKRTGVL